MKGYIIKGIYLDTSYGGHSDLIKSKDIYDNTVYLDKRMAESKSKEYIKLEKVDGIYKDFDIDEVNII